MKNYTILLLLCTLLFTQCQPLIDLPEWYDCTNEYCEDLRHETEACPNLNTTTTTNTTSNTSSQCLNENTYSGTGVRFSNNSQYCSSIIIDKVFNSCNEITSGDCTYISLSPGKHSYTIMQSYSSNCNNMVSVHLKTNVEFTVEADKTFYISF